MTVLSSLASLHRQIDRERSEGRTNMECVIGKKGMERKAEIKDQRERTMEGLPDSVYCVAQFLTGLEWWGQSSGGKGEVKESVSEEERNEKCGENTRGMRHREWRGVRCNCVDWSRKGRIITTFYCPDGPVSRCEE